MVELALHCISTIIGQIKCWLKRFFDYLNVAKVTNPYYTKKVLGTETTIWLITKNKLILRFNSSGKENVHVEPIKENHEQYIYRIELHRSYGLSS
jgi:hypothetical protein